MEKLKKYLEKIGINETQKGAIYTRPIECHKITYGDHYFYNAPNYFYNAYLIIFDYNTDADADYFRTLQEKENKIRAYAKKYNYEVFNSYIHPWARSFCIARRDDREKSEIFFSFRDETIEKVLKACDKEYIEGLSILGGEPMHPKNIEGTTKLAKAFKEKYPQKSLWAWSGFLFDKGLKDKDVMNYVDVLVDGQYVDALRNPTLEWRGSANQRVIDVKKSKKENKIISAI